MEVIKRPVLEEVWKCDHCIIRVLEYAGYVKRKDVGTAKVGVG